LSERRVCATLTLVVMNMRASWLFVVAAAAALGGCAESAGLEPCTAGEQSMPGSDGDPCAQDACTPTIATCGEDGVWGVCQCFGGGPPQGGSGGTGGGGATCGNSMIETGEECDTNNLNRETCMSLMKGDGMLLCDPVMCKFDDSMCMSGSGGVGGTGQ